MLVLATIKHRLHSLNCGILIMVWIYYSVLCNALLVMVLWSPFLGWNWARWPYLQCVAKHQMHPHKQSNHFQTKHISNLLKILNKLHQWEMALLWHQAMLMCHCWCQSLFLMFRSKSTESPELHWNFPLTVVTLGWVLISVLCLSISKY